MGEYFLSLPRFLCRPHRTPNTTTPSLFGACGPFSEEGEGTVKGKGDGDQRDEGDEGDEGQKETIMAKDLEKEKELPARIQWVLGPDRCPCGFSQGPGCSPWSCPDFESPAY